MAERTQKDIMLKVLGRLDELQARWFVAREAMILGHGGIKKMCELTDLSKPTIIKGIKELKGKGPLPVGEKIRRTGAGRKRIETQNPRIIKVLKEIMDETTAADEDRVF